MQIKKEESQNNMPPIVKRGRGRPRKNIPSTECITPTESHIVPDIGKKKRGRPRNNIIPSELISVDIPKRKRGRPRKEESKILVPTKTGKKRGRPPKDLSAINEPKTILIIKKRKIAGGREEIINKETKIIYSNPAQMEAQNVLPNKTLGKFMGYCYNCGSIITISDVKDTTDFICSGCDCSGKVSRLVEKPNLAKNYCKKDYDEDSNWQNKERKVSKKENEENEVDVEEDVLDDEIPDSEDDSEHLEDLDLDALEDDIEDEDADNTDNNRDISPD